MIGKNNPLNVRKSSNEWLGQTGSTKGFCDFQSVDYGVRAAMYLICRTYRIRYGLKTYTELITRYAPSVENDTAAYINFVCGHMRVSPFDSPFSDYTSIPLLLHYMSRFEGNYVPSCICYFVFKKYKKDFKL